MSMTKRNHYTNRIIFSTLEELVPQGHEVRKLEKAIDWTFIYPLVEKLYSKNGRPSVDPVVLFKMIFINYIFGYNSMRKTCREIEVNVAYRWFLGISFEEAVPNYSTWSQNYIRRYGESEVFEKIFSHILEEAMICGFINTETVYGDSTHTKANANKNKFTKAEVEFTKKWYEEDLLEEINEDRKAHGKKEIDGITRKEYDFNEKTGEAVERIKKKEIKQSKTDPESGDYHKGEHEKCFAYSNQTFCDENGFVLTVHTVPGNVHDSVSFYEAYEKLNESFGDIIKDICLDAGYKTPPILKTITDNNQIPFMPYKRPMTKDGFFRKYEFIYDEKEDQYICPNGKKLKYTTTDRTGYKEYKSNKKNCEGCPFIEKCTHSKNHQKLIVRHVWEEYVELAEKVRHTDEWKEKYPKRKQTIERVFADCKENHCLRFTRVKGLKKNSHVALLIFAGHNLQKMGKRKWKRFHKIHGCLTSILNFDRNRSFF